MGFLVGFIVFLSGFFWVVFCNNLDPDGHPASALFLIF